MDTGSRREYSSPKNRKQPTWQSDRGDCVLDAINLDDRLYLRPSSPSISELFLSFFHLLKRRLPTPTYPVFAALPHRIFRRFSNKWGPLRHDVTGAANSPCTSNGSSLRGRRDKDVRRHDKDFTGVFSGPTLITCSPVGRREKKSG